MLILFLVPKHTIRMNVMLYCWHYINRLGEQEMVVDVFQLLSRVWLFVTPWTSAHQASLSFITSWSLLKLKSIESVMPSNHFVLYLLLPSIFPNMRVFSNELALHIRWPKYCSFSFNISPSDEYWGMISFRIDWCDFIEVQGTLKSLLQHHISKASVLQLLAFFIVQVSHLYMTTEKNHSFDYIDLCWQSNVCFLICCLGDTFSSKKEVSFNFVATVTIFSDFAVILQPKKIKS